MPSRIPTHRPKFAPTKAQVRRAYENNAGRTDDRRFYSSQVWRKVRAEHLAEFPLCNRCPEATPTDAKEVHHKIPRDVRPDLALDRDNLEGLCVPCHRKTRTEDRHHRSR